MSADVAWSWPEILFQGLNEHIDPRVLPPGQLVTVENGEYRRPGGIRKRPGIGRIAIGSSGGVPSASTLVRHNREMLLLDGTGSTTVPPSLWTLNEGAAKWRRHVEMPSATVQTEPVAADLATSATADVAYAAGFIVQAFILVSTGDVIIRVRKAETGALVLEANAGAGRTSPRCATANNRYVAVTWIDTGGLLKGAYLDCSAATPSITSAGTIVSDVSTALEYHDMIGYAATNFFAIVYRQTTTNLLRVLRLSDVLAITHSALLGNLVQGFSLLEAPAAGNNGSIYVNWRNDDGAGTVNWQYALRDRLDLSNVLATTTWYAGAGASSYASAISLRADDSSVLLLRSELGPATPAPQVLSLAWRTATSAGVLGSTNEKRNCGLGGKPWRTGPNHTVWVVAGGTIDKTAGTYALIDLDETSDRAMLVSSVLSGAVTYLVFGIGHVPFSTPLDTTNNVRHGLAPVEYVPIEGRFGPRDLVVFYADLGRYKAVEFGGCTYMAGSCITQWDGARIHEVGFAVKPEIGSAQVAAGSGTWAATGTYSYVAVYEVTDSQRTRHRSAPSAIKTVTIAATTEVVTLKIEPLTVTRRYWNANTVERLPRVVVTIFRSNAPGSNVLQRLLRFDSASMPLSDPESLSAITFTDTGVAAQSPAEILYTTSGELENDPIEAGGTAICVHRDRMWVGGSGDPELIWYSKPAVDNRPAEFSIAQQLRIPGERVVALEGLRETLYAFCERGVFAVDGEGPDARGLDGSFLSPRLIERNVGCLSPTSVVAGPPGIFFHSDRGIELMDGQQVVFIGAPIETTLATFPHVLAAFVVPEKGQVRFVLADASRTDGRVAVYDYVEQKWAIWKHSAVPWIGASTWTRKNWATGAARGAAYLTPTGDLYEETPTNYLDTAGATTVPILMVLETGWLTFGMLTGYLRVRKFHPVIHRLGNHGLDVAMYFRNNDAATASRSFTLSEMAAFDVSEPIRIYVPQPKQTSPSIKIRLAETQTETEPGVYSPSEGFAAIGVGFEIGRIPGQTRLPAANTR